MTFTHQKSFLIYSLLALTILFLIYIGQQYSDLFFEAQFLHIGFIQDLITHTINPKNFFTTYGEHLFPGYNLLLLVNFKLFKISALFELICSAAASFGIVYILCRALKKENTSWWLPIAVFAIILSPVQNITWGMALAAHISTFMLVLIIFTIYFNERKYKLYLLALLIPIYVIFFAGAYSVGFLAALCSVFFFSCNAKNKALLWVLGITYVLSFAIYYFILKIYGDWAHDNPVSYHYSLVAIIQFANLMIASSVFGKAFFEAFNNLNFYSMAGIYLSILIFICAVRCCTLKNKLNKLDHFFIALFCYALLTILIVAVARNTNGADGALGQWYQSHLQFIPITLIYFLSRIQAHKKIFLFLRKFFIISVILLVAIGYIYEYRKGPYASEWKDNIKNSVADHLVHPDFYLNDNNPEPLMWDRTLINQGLLLFYEHDLAYFRSNQLQAPVTPDSWVEKKPNQPFFSVLCPAHTQSITFDISNIDSNNLALLPRELNISTQQEKRYHVSYTFHKKIKALTFNIDHFTPIDKKNSPDLRQLLFQVSNIQCNES